MPESGGDRFERVLLHPTENAVSHVTINLPWLAHLGDERQTGLIDGKLLSVLKEITYRIMLCYPPHSVVV